MISKIVRRKINDKQNFLLSPVARHNKITTSKIKNRKLRIQGIEPWSVPWEGTMIPLHQMRLMLTLALCYSYLAFD